LAIPGTALMHPDDAELEEQAVTSERRRVPLVGAISLCLLIIAGALLYMRMADPFNPYRPGTSHEVQLSTDGFCSNGWSAHLGSGSHEYRYAQGIAPAEWGPGPVPGTLHILSYWSSTGIDAVFESRGQQVSLTGGRIDGKHFFATGCSIGG
jgi:hypothetical protein